MFAVGGYSCLPPTPAALATGLPTIPVTSAVISITASSRTWNVALSKLESGLKIANRKVIQDGGMDASAQLKWGIRKATEIQEWDRRITVLAEYPIFRGLKGGLSWKEKCGTFLSDTLRIMSMIHLRMLGEREGRS